MIFGLGSPKFVYNATDYLLDYCTMDPSYISPDVVEHNSIISGHKEFVPKGDYAEFKLYINLFKYSNPRAKFEELYACNHKDVIFFPHREGIAIKKAGTSGVTDCLFFISEMLPHYLENLWKYDLLEITLKAKDYVDLSNQVVYPQQIDNIIMANNI